MKLSEKDFASRSQRGFSLYFLGSWPNVTIDAYSDSVVYRFRKSL